MTTPKRFWATMALVVAIQFILVYGKSELKVKRKAPLLYNERYTIDYATNMAIQGTLLALTVPNPLVGITAGFTVGTLINLIWPTDSYSPIRAKVIEDIRKEMNAQSEGRMKLKLRDYYIQIKDLFNILNIDKANLPQWQNSVKQNGINLTKQKYILEQFNISTGTMNYFKTTLRALLVDIGNDRQNFFQPNDPISSLAYYREFATIELNLIAAEMMTYASTHYLKMQIHRQFETAGKKHYRMMLWLAHKSAMILETNTPGYIRYSRYIRKSGYLPYSGIVKNILDEMPMEKWRSLGNVYYDPAIRFFDKVALKDTGSRDEWMSCWGSGSDCKTRNCPGIDNPYESGDQYQYWYKCRGEIFTIVGHGRYPRDSIQVCDKVALRYSYWGENKGYWFSRMDSFWTGVHYNTRTCPGLNFYNGYLNTCRAEVFTILVEGKNCGEILHDRDAFVLKNHKNGIVRNRGLWKTLADRSTSFTSTSLSFSFDTRWRIFKIDSLLKTYRIS